MSGKMPGKRILVIEVRGDLAQAMRFPPRYHRVELGDGLLDAERSARVQMALDRDYNACGCGLGGVALAITAMLTGPPLAAFWWFGVLGPVPALAAFLGLAAASVILGKAAGTAWAYHRLGGTVSALRHALADPVSTQFAAHRRPGSTAAPGKVRPRASGRGCQSFPVAPFPRKSSP